MLDSVILFDALASAPVLDPASVFLSSAGLEAKSGQQAVNTEGWILTWLAQAETPRSPFPMSTRPNSVPAGIPLPPVHALWLPEIQALPPEEEQVAIPQEPQVPVALPLPVPLPVPPVALVPQELPNAEATRINREAPIEVEPAVRPVTADRGEVIWSADLRMGPAETGAPTAKPVAFEAPPRRIPPARSATAFPESVIATPGPIQAPVIEYPAPAPAPLPAVEAVAELPERPLLPAQVATVQVEIAAAPGVDGVSEPAMRLVVSQRGDQVSVRLRSFDLSASPLDAATMRPLLDSLSQKGFTATQSLSDMEVCTDPVSRIAEASLSPQEGDDRFRESPNESARHSRGSHDQHHQQQRQRRFSKHAMRQETAGETR